MLNYYLYIPDNIEYVSDNETEFNTSFKYNYTRRIRDALDIIEGITLSKESPTLAYSKFGGDPFRILDISSGCKTAINILNNSNKVYSIAECGTNVLDYIYKLDIEFNVFSKYIRLSHDRLVIARCHLNSSTVREGRLCDISTQLIKDGYYESI